MKIGIRVYRVLKGAFDELIVGHGESIVISSRSVTHIERERGKALNNQKRFRVLRQTYQYLRDH